METQAIHEKLLAHFGPEVVLELTEADKAVRDPFITVAPRRIDKVGLYCRVDPELGFDFCQSITALDTGETITLVYHLFSYTHLHTVVLKTAVPRGAATLPTTVKVWPASDWYEREIYDLFGVDFAGHPDQRRLLLPDDWEGHPMLKDYVEQPVYNGMPTTRQNTLDLLDEEG